MASTWVLAGARAKVLRNLVPGPFSSERMLAQGFGGRKSAVAMVSAVGMAEQSGCRNRRTGIDCCVLKGLRGAGRCLRCESGCGGRKGARFVFVDLEFG